MSSTVVKADIVESVRRLEILSGNCVMLHSSLSSLGRVEGGADAVIDAFLEVLGPDGTLVVPTFCQKDKEKRFETWDIEKSHSDVGIITETFRLRPESHRSNHPTHSVAAIGRLAKYITETTGISEERPGPWGGLAFAGNSPWDRLHGANTQIVLLGVDFRVNSTVHYIEHLIAHRALQRFPDSLRSEKLNQLHGWQKPGVWPSFDRLKLQQALDDKGLIHHTHCGDAEIMMVNMREMVIYGVVWMEKEPDKWFDESLCNWLLNG